MNPEETSRRFYTTQHPLYCGIALHARTMSGCSLDQSGALLVHRHMPTDPETFLPAGAPYRPAMVGAVECLCPWDWLVDLGADEGSPCVLGPALSRKAIQRGHAHRKGALSAAAVLCLRDHPAAPPSLARLEPKHATGHALPILAPTLARAVSSMRQRPGAGDQEKCCQR
jgi:hypothetical protein